MLRFFFVCLFLCTSILGVFARERIVSIQESGKTDTCSIVGVDDGDTFNLDCLNGYYLNVRLIGVNTPDINLSKGVKSCYYDESRNYIREKKGRKYDVVFYGSDLCRDSYKGCRNLVQLTDRETRIDLAESLIMRGFGFSWTNFSMVNEKMRKRYDYMQIFAQNSRAGLWESCNIREEKHTTQVNSSIPELMTTLEQIQVSSYKTKIP